jgi:hypothetical protein
MNKLDDKIEESLGGVDYITNLLGNCPKVNCILDKLLSINNNQICNIMQSIDNDNNFGIVVESISKIGYYKGTNSKFEAQTIVTKGGNIKIQFDFEASCNSESPMGIAVAVMHEFMHANFFLELTKMGWDGKRDTFESIFRCHNGRNG